MEIKAPSVEDAQRRLRLRVVAKMMMYLALAGIAYVFISALSSGDSEVPEVPGLRVNIGALQPGEVEFLTWEGRPVLVYRRSDQDIVALRSSDPRLEDPQSLRSEQPDDFQNAWRSPVPEYFVAIALGTGQGCNMVYLPAQSDQFQQQPWAGGFMDSCGKDRFDLAGRVYEKQYASENLKVPQYTIEGTTLILGR